MSDNENYDQSVSAVHNRLFFRLFQAGNTLDRQSVKELGITTVQWATLGALSRPQVKDGMSFSDLADYLVVSRQSLDGVLKRLEREGHVARVVDPTDRRAKKVVMLPRGGRSGTESSQESMSSIVKRWQAFASTTRYLCCTTSTSSMTGCRRLPSGWGPTLRKVKARTRTRLRDELSSAVSNVAFWMGVMVWEPLSQRGRCNATAIQAFA